VLLYERFPEEMQRADAEGEPAVSVAIGLLEQFAQRHAPRIVLP
jgi:hypothetical protein